MIKKVILTCVLAIASVSMYAQIYLADSCQVSFFSSSPIRKIYAVDKAAKPIMNTQDGEIDIKVPIRAFTFDSPLMQEHFNEDYMESDKYPYATFKGKLDQKVDFSQSDVHMVSVTGTMDMHGVQKKITINGILTVKNGQIMMDAKFSIHIADYKIKVPSLYVDDIAKDVSVKLRAHLVPFKK